MAQQIYITTVHVITEMITTYADGNKRKIVLQDTILDSGKKIHETTKEAAKVHAGFERTFSLLKSLMTNVTEIEKEKDNG